MLKAGLFGLIGLLGMSNVAGCSSTTSHVAGNGTEHGGSADAAAGADAAGGTDAVGGPSATLPDDPTTAQGFCADFYAVVEDLFVKCWGLTVSEAQSPFTDPTLCAAFTSSIDQHRIRFDGSHAQACLGELRSAEQKSAAICEGSSQAVDPPDCVSVLTPLVAPGESCSVTSGLVLGRECTGDAFCRATTADACSGVCVERSPIGADCDSRTTDVRCATGATCDSATQKCVPTPALAALGEACGGTADGKCNDGLWCDRGSGGAASPGVCSTRKASGACTFSSECQSAKICAGAADAKSCVDPKPLGATCTAGNRECSVVSYCDSEQKCSDVAAALGQPCGILQGESVPCARGAYCEGGLLGAGVCQTPKAAGTACSGTSLGECGGYRGHCDATSHTCVACP